MNFGGWVAVRRGILEHVMDGKLSTTEYAVFMTLVLLADRRTGSGRTNAAALRTYLPGLKYETAKRTLTSLQKKGYIWRSIRPRSTAVYPYWVNHYEITDGPRKAFQTNLSQVFITGDISTITYDKHVPQDAPESHLPGNPRRPHQNNNDNDNRQKQSSLVTEMGAHERLHETGSASLSTGERVCPPERACEHENAHEPPCSVALLNVPRCAESYRAGKPGYVPVGNVSTGRWQDHTGRLLTVPEGRAALEALGIEQYGTQFFPVGSAMEIRISDALAVIANGGPVRSKERKAA